MSVGCGSSYAVGAMKAIADNTTLNAQEIAEKALEIASHFSGAVRPPFNFVNTNPDSSRG
jgi:ATP-dependent protease HslVU (ClpYQ) peptidase subunit